MHVQHQLLPWKALKQGRIDALALRTYCALHEMAERRRYRPDRPARFGPEECRGLLGPSVRVSHVEHRIEDLSTTVLVDWSPSALRFPIQPEALPGIDLRDDTALWADVHPKRMWVSPGRRMMRYLAHEGCPGLIATVFYVTRHCYWNGTEGVCAGAIATDALAACYGFTEKTASRHLATLEALCWFTTEPRPRWYERTYGRWCVLNGVWEPPKHTHATPSARAPRLRRPQQLSLPLPEDAGDTARTEASPAPARAASGEHQDTGLSSLLEVYTTASVAAQPPLSAPGEPGPDAREGADDGCQILSESLPIISSNHTNLPCSSISIPFQEIYKHQKPAPPMDTTPAAVSTPQDLLTPTPGLSGVLQGEERKATGELSTEQWAALEATYAALPPNRQATLRADAVTRLLQQGHDRAFLIQPVIMTEICCLLAAQEGCAAPQVAVAPPQDALASSTPTPGIRSVAKDKTAKATAKLPTPQLSHVIIEDLQETGRLLVLLDQSHGLDRQNASDRLTFVALAEHALRVGSENPCGLFARLLGRQCWEFITDADDTAAQARLKEYDYGITPRRKPQPPPTAIDPAALSNDAWVMRELQRECARAGLHGDVFELVHREDRAWTRERWDHAVRELEQAKRAWKQAQALNYLGDLRTAREWLPSRDPAAEAGEACPECGEDGQACACVDTEDGP